eukprot:6201691-Pleurochrysis_carterae.AAC.2
MVEGRSSVPQSHADFGGDYVADVCVTRATEIVAVFLSVRSQGPICLRRTDMYVLTLLWSLVTRTSAADAIQEADVAGSTFRKHAPHRPAHPRLSSPLAQASRAAAYCKSAPLTVDSEVCHA